MTLLEKKEIITYHFTKILKQWYGNRLEKIILYGSYARGDCHENSDIDFLVVLRDEKVSVFKEIRDITKLVFQMILDYDILISYHFTTTKKYQKDQTALFHFIRKEGIEL